MGSRWKCGEAGGKAGREVEGRGEGGRVGREVEKQGWESGELGKERNEKGRREEVGR